MIKQPKTIFGTISRIVTVHTKVIISCQGMQCNAMQCNAMQCNAMQCDTTIRYSVIILNTNYTVLQYSNTLFYMILNGMLLHYITLYIYKLLLLYQDTGH